MSPERKELWIKAFDPYSHAQAIQAKFLSLSSSCDHFCALGDMVQTYLAIPAEKSIFIDINFDHSVPSFDGRPKYGGLWKWLEYGFGTTDRPGLKARNFP